MDEGLGFVSFSPVLLHLLASSFLFHIFTHFTRNQHVFIQFLKARISEVQPHLYLFYSELTYLLFVLLL